jgi:hypothetical protein
MAGDIFRMIVHVAKGHPRMQTLPLHIQAVPGKEMKNQHIHSDWPEANFPILRTALERPWRLYPLPKGDSEEVHLHGLTQT